MTYGFVSDVHGDLAALEWALEVLSGADQVYFLGDVCGGSDVAACLDTLRARGVFCIPGNHDLWDFELTGLAAEQRQFLAQLPLSREVDDWLAVHSDYERDAHGVRFPYIHSESDARRALALFPQRLVFFGHTHLSQVHCLRPDGTIEFTRVRGSHRIEPGCRYLVNLGAAPDVCLLYDRPAQLLHYHFRKKPERPAPKTRPWWRLFG